MLRLAMAAGLCAALLSVAPPARANPDAFTAEELSRLESGKLVIRPAVKHHGRTRLIGGSSWQVIDAPLDVVWRALLDTQYYPRMLPEVDEAHVVARDGDRRRTVFVRHRAGLIEASYYLDVDIDAKRRDIRFKIDTGRPHDLRGAWGLYALRPYSGGRSLLAFRVMADIEGGLLGMLVEPLLHKWMLRIPWTVRRFVEGSGKYIYGY